MAFDERDRNFEKALARHLRPGAAPENSANLQRTRDPADAACPDAEILAAYHERSLSQEELISWKSHIAGCARCQELLAQLELTDKIPVDVLPVGAQHAAPLLGTVATPAPSAQPAKVQILPVKRNSRLRWVAPAGAIAAGLLVWIAIRENKMLPSSTPQRVEMADRVESPVATANPTAAPPASDDAKQDKPNRAMSAPAPQPKESSKEKDAFAKALPPANLPMNGRSMQELQFSRKKGAAVGGALPANQNGAALDSASGARPRSRMESNQIGGPTQTVEVQSSNQQIAVQAQPPTDPLPAQNPLSPSAASPAQSGDAVSQNLTNEAVASAETRSFSPNLALKKVRAIAAHDARLAIAPSGNVVWHAGLSGLIEKSTNGGKTFTRQESGVKSELVAASAPDDSVCWVVGRSGTILLTTDGGAHWNKLVSPLQENIGGVHAEDGLHATIWDVANRVSFATADGGTTWTRVANE